MSSTSGSSENQKTVQTSGFIKCLTLHIVKNGGGFFFFVSSVVMSSSSSFLTTFSFDEVWRIRRRRSRRRDVSFRSVRTTKPLGDDVVLSPSLSKSSCLLERSKFRKTCPIEMSGFKTTFVGADDDGSSTSEQERVGVRFQKFSKIIFQIKAKKSIQTTSGVKARSDLHNSLSTTRFNLKLSL